MLSSAPKLPGKRSYRHFYNNENFICANDLTMMLEAFGVQNNYNSLLTKYYHRQPKLPSERSFRVHLIKQNNIGVTIIIRHRVELTSDQYYDNLNAVTVTRSCIYRTWKTSRDFSSRYVRISAPEMAYRSPKLSWMYFPKREELSFLIVCKNTHFTLNLKDTALVFSA